MDTSDEALQLPAQNVYLVEQHLKNVSLITGSPARVEVCRDRQGFVSDSQVPSTSRHRDWSMEGNTNPEVLQSPEQMANEVIREAELSKARVSEVPGKTTGQANVFN